MAIKAFADLNCSIARPLSFLGERWAVLVLRDLFLGRRRFDEIQDSLGVASNVLSQRLATLVEEGIVERRRYSEHPERFEYRLTQKGLDLQPVLLALLRWGDHYTTGPEGRRWKRSTRTVDTRSTWFPPARSAAAKSSHATPRAGPARARLTSSAVATPSAALLRQRGGTSADRRMRLPRQVAGRAAARAGLGGARDEPA